MVIILFLCLKSILLKINCVIQKLCRIKYNQLMFQGTDLQKYLNAVGYSGFEVSNPKVVQEICSPKVSLDKQSKIKSIQKQS